MAFGIVPSVYRDLFEDMYRPAPVLIPTCRTAAYNNFPIQTPNMQAARRPASPKPSLRISEYENGHMITAVLPGYSEEDIRVDVSDRVLTLSARTSAKCNCWECQRYTLPPLSRSFRLGRDIDIRRIRAQFRHGILTVTLPTHQYPVMYSSVAQLQVHPLMDLTAAGHALRPGHHAQNTFPYLPCTRAEAAPLCRPHLQYPATSSQYNSQASTSQIKHGSIKPSNASSCHAAPALHPTPAAASSGAPGRCAVSSPAHTAAATTATAGNITSKKRATACSPKTSSASAQGRGHSTPATSSSQSPSKEVLGSSATRMFPVFCPAPLNTAAASDRSTPRIIPVMGKESSRVATQAESPVPSPRSEGGKSMQEQLAAAAQPVLEFVGDVPAVGDSLMADVDRVIRKEMGVKSTQPNEYASDGEMDEDEDGSIEDCDF